jgi:hypothetical protein
MKESASKILMIRPLRFGFNEQTAGSNSFQNNTGYQPEFIQQQALSEFNTFAEKLKTAGISVEIFDDTPEPHTPDSVFPNNWISFHEEKVVLYPMLAENRRHERRKDIIGHFSVSKEDIIDLSDFEKKMVFLEGTGSIVFDYRNKLAFANLSPRTNSELLNELCSKLGYAPVTFRATDEHGADIYHTNVLMCIGTTFAVLCEECIPEEQERIILRQTIQKTGKEIISISRRQMNSFAGNMYQLFNERQESIIVMSEQAFKSLVPDQVHKLEKHGNIIHSPLYTIEKYGGGSARCMIADVRV